VEGDTPLRIPRRKGAIMCSKRLPDHPDRFSDDVTFWLSIQPDGRLF
jgi:hypothetical protein